jgi:hypothetical protein
VPFRHSPQSITPAHWSKDFVEHLRTVHLTLIATAAALIVVALTTKSYSTEVAKNELHKILELQKNWSPDLYLSFKPEKGGPFLLGASKVHSLEAARENRQSQKRLGLIIDEGIDDILAKEDIRKAVQIDCGLKTSHSISEAGHERKVDIDFPDECLLLGVDDSVGKARGPDQPLGKIPETLAGVEQWWDDLDRSDRALYTPTKVGQIAAISEATVMGSRRFTGPINSPWEVLALTVTGPPRNFKPFEIDDDLNLDLPYSGSMKLDVQHDRTSNSLRFAGFFEPSNRKDPRLYVVFPVITYDYVKLDSTSLSSYMKLVRGDADHIFYDLRRVADKNGYENLSKLEDVLSKSEVSETAVFEAFGIKFPADVATLGGTVALLSVQLYFFLYLRKLSGSLKPDDPGWDVPWIGMDSSGLARTIFQGTVVIVPIASIVLLGGAAAARFTRGYRQLNSIHLLPHCQIWNWHWTTQVKAVLLIAAVILSAILGVLCWKYRPQLTPSTPTEEPEWSTFGE